MGFFELVLILFLAVIVNLALAQRDLRGFLREHRRIASSVELQSFMGMVRKQMYQALVQIVLTVGMGVLSVLGILLGKISGFQFLIIIVLNAIVVWAGRRGKEVEHRARNLPADDPELKRQHSDICHSWRFRAFPDF